MGPFFESTSDFVTLLALRPPFHGVFEHRKVQDVDIVERLTKFVALAGLISD